MIWINSIFYLLKGNYEPENFRLPIIVETVEVWGIGFGV